MIFIRKLTYNINLAFKQSLYNKTQCGNSGTNSSKNGWETLDRFHSC